MSQSAEASQTASDYIATQLKLEEDAREALPYQFDTCTKPLGPLRQSVFACLTCTPPPASAHQQHTPAGICYSCSISCHGEHNLVELFTKRDFVCDCGTTRFSNSKAPCNLRLNSNTGRKGGIVDEEPRAGNRYDQNYGGQFCGCGEAYDPEKEKGTMFQCLGLGTIDAGGCGEDWWHPECLMGLSRNTASDTGYNGSLKAVKEEEPQTNSDYNEEPGTNGNNLESEANGNHDDGSLPLGFPHEDDFDHFICYKCVSANPWIKQYANTPGFLPALVHRTTESDTAQNTALVDRKRKADDDFAQSDLKRSKNDSEDVETVANADAGHKASVILSKSSNATLGTAQNTAGNDTAISKPPARHETLPEAPSEQISLFLKEDFRDHFCRCAICFPRLARNPQLLEEEDSYAPPLSESDDEQQSVAGRSVNSGSLLERGEAALSSMDRVKAIEGIMAYNHVRDKVKEFLKPYAESGKEVGAEDIKAYFAQLRGDEEQQTG